MRDDLVEAARAFQAATTKTASWDGPYAWMDDKMLRVWLVMESYGRVHHVTGDLTQAEKVLDKARSKLVAAQSWLGQEHFVYMDIGDIYVDGLKGGRNRMIMEFYARLNLAKGSEEEQDAVAEALGHSVTWKNAPPPTK